MENCFKYFLIVAEELNITRAAQKSNITQQSMSAQIKRLEDELDTQLFFRRPTLRLTYAGEVLLDTLNEIKILEDNFIKTVHGDKGTYKGTLVVGMSHARANLLIPDIVSSFKKRWPNINVLLQQDYTYENLDNRIVNGYLDVFVGIADKSGNQDIQSIHVKDEKFYMLVSDNMMEKYVSCVNHPDAPSDIFLMKCFDGATYILDKASELNYKLFERYLINSGIEIEFVIRCNDSQLRTSMCAQDIGVTVVNELMLKYALDYNSECPENRINIIPLAGLRAPSVVMYHKNRLITPVIRDFINMSIAVTEEYHRAIEGVLNG